MRAFILVLGSGLLALSAAAQGLTNVGSTLTVPAGAVLYVGPDGLANQAGGTLTTAGALRVDGPLTNAGTLDLGSGTLDVRGDLTNTGTLVPGTGVVTFSGAANQLLAPGGATLYQVLVNKSTAGANTLRLTGDLTVSNALTLSNGLVNTQNGGTLNTLRLPNGATLSGEATGRYVLGNLEITRNAVSGAAVDFGHGALLDPLTNNLGTVVITRTAGLNAANVSFGQNQGNNSLQGIDRIWTVAPATQPSAAVQLTLSWLPDDDHGLTNFTQAQAWQQATASQPWVAASAPTDASSRSLTFSPLVLNRFTISNADNPLPVTLLDFTAALENPAAVRLRWVTASELHNAGFTVERSLDGLAFAPIGAVAGAGTSPARHDYTLLDGQLPAGASLLYYRLRQLDTDGTTTYSPVRTVHITPARPATFIIYPNPARAQLTAADLPANATVDVLDALGRRVATATADAAGTAQLVLPTGLAAGVYVVRSGAQARRLTVE